MKDLDSQLQGVQTAAIAGHVRPDGDCVGSCLATYNYIKDNYPQIQVDLYLEPIPNIFKFFIFSIVSQNCTNSKQTFRKYVRIFLDKQLFGWYIIEKRTNVCNICLDYGRLHK